jgi:hypothetical protein
VLAGVRSCLELFARDEAACPTVRPRRLHTRAHLRTPIPTSMRAHTHSLTHERTHTHTPRAHTHTNTCCWITCSGCPPPRASAVPSPAPPCCRGNDQTPAQPGLTRADSSPAPHSPHSPTHLAPLAGRGLRGPRPGADENQATRQIFRQFESRRSPRVRGLGRAGRGAGPGRRSREKLAGPGAASRLVAGGGHGRVAVEALAAALGDRFAPIGAELHSPEERRHILCAGDTRSSEQAVGFERRHGH